MKTRLPLVLWMVATLYASSQARAQDVRYDFTGTYADTTPTTSLTAPGGAFTFEFLVPATVPNDTPWNEPFYLSTPLLSASYTFDGQVTPISSGDYTYSNTNFNSAGMDLNGPVADFTLFFYDSGALAGRPDALGQSHFVTGNLSRDPENNLVSGIGFTPLGAASFTINNVPISAVGTPVPEPSSLGLLAVGLAACSGVGWARCQRVGSPIPLP